MNDFTIPTAEEIDGKNHLDIIDVAQAKSELTDYSIILGGYLDSDKDHYGYYWTKTLCTDKHLACVADTNGRVNIELGCQRINGTRVVYNVPTSIEKELKRKFKTGSKTIFKVQYGFYPQTAVSLNFGRILDKAYDIGKMKRTGNYYTFDSRKPDDGENVFLRGTNEEYIFQTGERYVRTHVNANCRLASGQKCETGEYVWVCVEPVIWFLDTEKHIMLSEKLLFSGIQFADNPNFDAFEETRLYMYLNICFANELTQGLNDELLLINDKAIKDYQLYNLDFSKVSEEDIIKGALLSNISVFLHGRSSDGKSSRVKQLDPDCVILYLRNATPDSLNGKSVYNSGTGAMIDVPPTWYKKIVAKCEAEPDKLHIVFFDELTNALPSIQGMAFNIILDGEVNGIWKLPENARIVAAGNDLDDSLAANAMAEPLFNRFAHVYINTTTDDWLKWAITPAKNYEQLHYQKRETSSKIHPTIYAYIAYKNAVGMNVLRTHYDGKSPNADPRKWEMASKVLYATRKPEMLRSLIGEYLTRDFIDFCTQKVISIEDVLTGNYTEDDLQMSPSKKYATIVNLSLVDEENIETIRTFISKLDNELLATFDLLWTNGNEERLEKIQELKLEKLLNKK